MIPWTENEKKVLLKEDTSKKAIEKYYKAFPSSNREKSTLYTYWWWRKQEEKKKIADKNIVGKAIVNKITMEVVSEIGKNVIYASIGGNNANEVVNASISKRSKKYPKITLDKKTVEEIFPKPEQVHATITSYSEIPNFEIGDSVRYARGSALLSPIGVVTNSEKKQGIPAKSQKMKVRFDNYNVREVYCCDYIIVVKRKN